MEVELFVHGVPHGEGFWGKEDDRNYFGTFYDHSTDELKFLVQSRMARGRQYCYYNYLVYKTVTSPTPNVAAYDGRDGSYFGLSLRLDAYCKDVMNVYRILDTIYNIYVYGSLLKMERSKLKYTFSDFAQVDAKLRVMESEVIKLLRNGFTAASFVPLDGFANGNGNAKTYNLYELGDSDAMQVIKQTGKIVLSPYYPTMRERTMRQECDNRIVAVRQLCDRTQAELNAEKQKVAARDGTINQLQRDLQRAGQSQHVGQLVATLRVPMTELSQALNAIDSNAYEGKKGTSQPSLLKKIAMLAPVCNFVLLLAIFVLVIPSLNKTPIDPPPVVVSDTARQNNGNVAKNGMSVEQESTDENIVDVSKEYPDFNMERVRIDIRNYNGGDLKFNEIYTVEAKNGIDMGTWSGEGCDIDNTDNPNIIKLRPTAESVTIRYEVKGLEPKIRTLTAK